MAHHQKIATGCLQALHLCLPACTFSPFRRRTAICKWTAADVAAQSHTAGAHAWGCVTTSRNRKGLHEVLGICRAPGGLLASTAVQTSKKGASGQEVPCNGCSGSCQPSKPLAKQVSTSVCDEHSIPRVTAGMLLHVP